MIDKYLYTIVITAVIFNKENRVLLTKRNMKEEILPGYWGIPGGKAETRESVNNFLENELKREIKEEVDIEIKNIKFLENHLYAPKSKIQICFIADIRSGKPKALDEVDEVRWFTFKEAKKLKLTPMSLERLKLAFKKRKSRTSPQRTRYVRAKFKATLPDVQSSSRVGFAQCNAELYQLLHCQLICRTFLQTRNGYI